MFFAFCRLSVCFSVRLNFEKVPDDVLDTNFFRCIFNEFGFLIDITQYLDLHVYFYVVRPWRKEEVLTFWNELDHILNHETIPCGGGLWSMGSLFYLKFSLLRM